MIRFIFILIIFGCFPLILPSGYREDILCNSRSECQNSAGVSFCEDGKCVCPSGYRLTGEGYCEKHRLLESCKFNASCSDAVKNSYCSEQQLCLCLPNYSSDNNVCRSTKVIELNCAYNRDCQQLNVTCEDSSECTLAIDGGECIDGLCSCPESFTRVNISHCQRAQILSGCSKNSTCHSVIPFSYCSENQICLCRLGYYADEKLEECNVRRIGKGSCRFISECETVINNSYCDGQLCQCKLGYKPNEDESSCLDLLIGDPCSSSKECYVSINNSYCHENVSTCHCESGFIDCLSLCMKRRIDDKCQVDIDCYDAVNHSLCNEDSICECISGYAVSEDNKTCHRRKIWDDNCLTRNDCSDSISNGNCSFEGQCVCDLGHYPDKNDPYTCISRMLGDNSTCSVDIDCSSVINNSICSNNSCRCKFGHIGLSDNRHCRARILGDDCKIDEDCNSVVQSSRCYHEKYCSCLSGFAEMNIITCQRRKIGDQNCAVNSDCFDAVRNSECRMTTYLQRVIEAGNFSLDSKKTCLCKFGYYEQDNGTTCTLRKIGDSCNEKRDCNYAVAHSVCSETWFNCTCDYDHMVVLPDMTVCVDRPIIDQYKPDEVLRNFRRTHGCGRVFQYHKHTQQCPMASSCTEGGMMRDVYRKQPHCHRSNAYILRFNCNLIVGKYELVPLYFNGSFKYNRTSDVYWENALRISFYGIDKIIQEINTTTSKPTFHVLASKYLSSKVLQFKSLEHGGVQAIVAIFFRFDKNISQSDVGTIHEMAINYLDRYEGQIGISKIYMNKPYNENFQVEDFNECAGNLSYPAELDFSTTGNDCDHYAYCVNIQGFYRCVCGTSFVDKSTDIEFTGRTCIYKAEAFRLEIMLSKAECTENKCETPWSFVIFVTTIIFGLLFLLLIVEIVWRMKQMSRNLDEKCRRQTAQLELKLALMKEERRKNINRLLGRPAYECNDQDEITHIEFGR